MGKGVVGLGRDLLAPRSFSCSLTEQRIHRTLSLRQMFAGKHMSTTHPTMASMSGIQLSRVETPMHERRLSPYPQKW